MNFKTYVKLFIFALIGAIICAAPPVAVGCILFYIIGAPMFIIVGAVIIAAFFSLFGTIQYIDHIVDWVFKDKEGK